MLKGSARTGKVGDVSVVAIPFKDLVWEHGTENIISWAIINITIVIVITWLNSYFAAEGKLIRCEHLNFGKVERNITS